MTWRRWLTAVLAYGVLAIETIATATAHPLEAVRGFAGVDEHCVTPPATTVGSGAPGTWTVGGSG